MKSRPADRSLKIHDHPVHLACALVIMCMISGAGFAASPTAEPAVAVSAGERYIVNQGGVDVYRIPIDLLAFVSDADGEPLSISTGVISPVGLGQLVNGADGLFTYVVDVADFANRESNPTFSYTVTDSSGNEAQGTVSIVSGFIVTPLRGVPDSYDIVAGCSRSLDVLSNDEGDGPLSIASVSTPPSRGQVEIDPTGLMIIYTPNADFTSGQDSFAYVPQNEAGLGTEAMVTLTIATGTCEPPELRVERNWGSDTSEIVSGNSITLPEVAVSGIGARVGFLIRNDGTGDLVLRNAGADVGAGMVVGPCFEIRSDGHPASLVAPGQSTPLELWWGSTCAAGTYQATVTIESNDGDEDPLTFQLIGDVSEPEPPIEVYQGWDSDGDGDYDFADEVLVPNGGEVVVPKELTVDELDSVGVRFLVLNSSTYDYVEITNVATAIENDAAGCFSHTLGSERLPSFIDLIHNFRMAIQCGLPGLRTASVTLETRSPDGTVLEPYVFNVRINIKEPEIQVVRGPWSSDTAEITGAMPVELPGVAVAGDTTNSVPFHIHNTASGSGAGNLLIKNRDSSLVAGSCFGIREGGLPAPEVEPGLDTPFRIWWGGSCTAPGWYEGTVTIENNDVDEDPLVFTVRGHVATVPVLTCEPSDLRVAAGEMATFSVCTQKPNGTLAYKWFKDGVEIAGDAAKLLLASVTDADEGLYHVEVSNEATTGTAPVVSVKANLEVIHLPDVTPFVDQTVNVGDTAEFTVTVNSQEDGPYGYNWQKIPPGGELVGIPEAKGQATLTLTGVTADMDGTQYRCLVGNDAGQSNTGFATLTVLTPPVITSQPQSQKVASGSDVSFTVTATGSPAPTYLWKKNAVSLGVTTPTLSLSGVTDADEGNYRVVVDNTPDIAGDSVVSQIAALVVVNLADVSLNDETVNAGGTATFTVILASTDEEDAPIGYIWQKLPPGGEVVGIPEARGQATLTLTGVTADMDGTQYRCLVGNDAGQSNTGFATLTVLAPPVITSQPQSQRVASGSSVIFSVTATGSPAPTYLWKKGGVSLGVTTRTLSLSGVTDTDEGNYRVLVSNSHGSVTSGIATLTVVNPPEVSPLSDQTVNAGSTATFTVTLNSPAEDGPFGYHWQKIPPGGQVVWIPEANGQATLTLTGVTADMDGTQYRCLVGNDAGQANTGFATLTVLSPPVITSQPQSQRVASGSSVSFSVTATGSPAPNYLWKKGGVSLGVTTPILSLSGVTDIDEGNYRVLVSNSHGSVTSGIAALTVVNKAVVTKPRSTTVAEGSTATFTVQVTSTAEDGPFTYFWQRKLASESSFSTISSTTTPNTSHTLSVSNATISLDGAWYRCIVRNIAGNTNSQYATLTVIPSTVRATLLGDTYVWRGAPYNNYGTSASMYLRSSGSDSQAHGYVRFRLQGVQGRVTSAKLRLRVGGSNISGLSVYGIRDWAWSETGLTYNNASLDVFWNQLGIFASAYSWLEVDVKPVVSGNGYYTFGLVHSGDYYRTLYTKEAGSPPELVITQVPW